MREFALEAYFTRWQGRARHQLAASESETLSLAELVAVASDEDRRRWETLQLGYTEASGSFWLREAIAEGYNSATAESVLCFAGAQEGICAAMHALLDAGDHAVVVLPNYQSAETIPVGICAVTGVGLELGKRLVARHRSGQGRHTSQYQAHIDQFPQQPDRQDPGARSLRCARCVLPPPRHLALQRRNLSIDRTRSGQAPAARGRCL